jgi:hypothetical protein
MHSAAEHHALFFTISNFDRSQPRSRDGFLYKGGEATSFAKNMHTACHQTSPGLATNLHLSCADE